MSGPGLSALRDPEALQQADHGRLLAALGYAGAQVRVVSGQRDRLPTVDRPRSLVVIGPSAPIDVALLSAVLGPAPAPVVAAADLPAWVGALDVVVVLAGSVDDARSAAAGAVALRRGATTVVRAAAEGPVADATRPALLPSELALPELLAAPSRWALLAAVAAAAGLGAQPDLDALADLLDAGAPALHPSAESFLNPAANLAEHLGGGTPLLVGADAAADALLAHGAAVLTGLAGIVGGVLPSARAVGRPPVLARIGSERDIFADPFDDDAAQRVQPVLVSTADPTGPDRAAAALVSGLRRAVPSAYHLDGWATAQAVPDGTVLPPAGQGFAEAAPPRTAGPEDPWARVFTAGRVLDATAAYLAVATGAPWPDDHPAGLGRSAGTRWDLRPVPAPADPDGSTRESDQTWM
ncbi:hypothetical protein GIS00_09065 [Nakamurella sp. YIM 132087]|uniref:Glucose-6-phosphate isomerase n=1 Tax=Nakamurella alba TaxID=2665158 RepID=A0A7K1FMU3_9ACTN|nr:hypothetical protein [Nakamurella alba]MTD14094.1 hypothetical protein [Nakamurella alba]